jgi:O-antigen/teichoic acid export membrane protein
VIKLIIGKLKVQNNGSYNILGEDSNLLKFLNANKGLVFISGGNLSGALITGIFWLLLATIQNPEEYGHTNYIISISSLASAVALLGLNTTLTSFLSKGDNNVLVQANQVALLSGIAISLLTGVMLGWLAAAFVITMTFWMMSTYSLLGKKRYKEYSVVNIGTRGLQLVLSFVFYFLFGIPGIIMAFIVAFSLFSYRYFHSLPNFNFRLRQIGRNKLSFSVHAYAFNMSTAFLMYFDKLIILPLFGYTIVGYYQISLQFLLFIGMVPISFYQYLISEDSSGKNKSKVTIMGLGFSVLLAIALFVLSPSIIQTLFPNFIESVDATRIISIGIIPMTIVWTTNSTLFNLGKSRFVALGSAIYLSTQIVLIYFLGNALGVNGLTMALDIALGLQAVFLFVSKRYWIA